MSRIFLINLVFLLTFSMNCALAHTQEQIWQNWLKKLRHDALLEGISPVVFQQALAGIKPNPKVIHFDRRQPEKKLTFLDYRKSRATPVRILLGRQTYYQHLSLLEKLGKDYHVDPCIITALWGMETNYGRYMGNFPVIRSLATLAFDNRRKDFFRHELLIALHILQEKHVTLADFKGEWAGGSGHPQFLPSSWQRYAVDYDRDGRRNIWTSYADGLASIANYLALNGWEENQPWAIPVILPINLTASANFSHEEKTVAAWQQLGVKISSSTIEPNLIARIIIPEGGPALMVFNNFNVIMSYNHSTYYAGTVGYLAEKICQKKFSAKN